MRRIIDNQFQIDQTDISAIKIDLNSRDEVPQILLGLQHIFTDPQTRQEVFAILQKLIPADVRADTGRRGMDLWKILVMGVLRLKCDWDYDHLLDQVNSHITIRQMLGHGLRDFERKYSLQTLKDNVSLFTPEILDEINRLVIKQGHRLLGQSNVPLKAQADSFVVETDVHFPTDINLLWDALRKLIALITAICGLHGIVGWRQSGHWLRKVKQAFRQAQKAKHSTSKDDGKKAQQEQKKKAAHQEYIDLAQTLINRVVDTLKALPADADKKQIEEIQYYLDHAQKQVGLIGRRVINGEVIPHEEKVFSLFEPHTRWISKGKAGVPQELGLPVCIMRDQFGFILDHLVMEAEVDVDVAVTFTQQVKGKHANLDQCSYDQGFHSPANQKKLAETLSVVILPKKGKKSAAEQERESTEAFGAARRQHPAVESAINALEHSGLDRCPDHGLTAFKRYVGLAVLARNLQILGCIVQQQRRQEQKEQEASVRQRRAA
jgi:hypothetical protein